MTPEQIEQMRADIEAGTPGPWGWEVNLSCQQVELCGGKGGTDLTVMSFVRWGMQRAAPMFWKWMGNTADEPKRADAVAVPVKGREHHENWFRRIDHPDARRITRVPDLEAEVLRLRRSMDVAATIANGALDPTAKEATLRRDLSRVRDLLRSAMAGSAE